MLQQTMQNRNFLCLNTCQINDDVSKFFRKNFPLYILQKVSHFQSYKALSLRTY